MVEVGVGQQDGVERRPGRSANGIRLRTDSFGLPWNIPQSMRTCARSVTSRYCEPVTVVAPPRKCDLHGRMVTARRGRAAYPPGP